MAAAGLPSPGIAPRLALEERIRGIVREEIERWWAEMAEQATLFRAEVADFELLVPALRQRA